MGTGCLSEMRSSPSFIDVFLCNLIGERLRGWALSNIEHQIVAFLALRRFIGPIHLDLQSSCRRFHCLWLDVHRPQVANVSVDDVDDVTLGFVARLEGRSMPYPFCFSSSLMPMSKVPPGFELRKAASPQRHVDVGFFVFFRLEAVAKRGFPFNGF